MLQFSHLYLEQESIPVGCVPPTSVATTRCQHQGVYLMRGCTRGVPDVPIPRRDLVLGILTPSTRDLGPGILTPKRDCTFWGACTGVYQEYQPTPRRNLGLGIYPLPNRHTVNENITFPQLDWRPVINIHINWGRNSNSHHFQINSPGVMSQLQFTKPMLYPLHVRYEVVNLQGGTWKMVMGWISACILFHILIKYFEDPTILWRFFFKL